MVNTWWPEEYHMLKCYCYVILPLHRGDKNFLSVKVEVTYFFSKFILVSSMFP